METPRARVVAFDFDGVIAQYAGFVDAKDTQEPITEVREAMRLLRQRGHKILIHSTRGNDFIEQYCEQFSIPYDYINRYPHKEGENPGKPIAFVYVDDRAVCYRGQCADELVDEIENFKAHWEV